MEKKLISLEEMANYENPGFWREKYREQYQKNKLLERYTELLEYDHDRLEEIIKDLKIWKGREKS